MGMFYFFLSVPFFLFFHFRENQNLCGAWIVFVLTFQFFFFFILFETNTMVVDVRNGRVKGRMKGESIV